MRPKRAAQCLRIRRLQPDRGGRCRGGHGGGEMHEGALHLVIAGAAQRRNFEASARFSSRAPSAVRGGERPARLGRNPPAFYGAGIAHESLYALDAQSANLNQRQIRLRQQRDVREFAARELRKRRRRDHGRVVRRKPGRGEKDRIRKSAVPRPPRAIRNCTRHRPRRSGCARRFPPPSVRPAAAVLRSPLLERSQKSSVGCGVTASHCSRVGCGSRDYSSRRAATSADISRASNHRSTAVFSPLKLKSSVLPFILASVNGTAFGSPCGASMSITGPPG